MTRYLLPIALLSLFAMVAEEAVASPPMIGRAYVAQAIPHHRHHHHNFVPAPSGPSISPNTGGYGGFGNGFGSGNYGFVPYYGGYGYGYPGFPPSGYIYPQSYFANPNNGQWGGFGP